MELHNAQYAVLQSRGPPPCWKKATDTVTVRLTNPGTVTLRRIQVCAPGSGELLEDVPLDDPTNARVEVADATRVSVVYRPAHAPQQPRQFMVGLAERDCAALRAALGELAAPTPPPAGTVAAPRAATLPAFDTRQLRELVQRLLTDPSFEAYVDTVEGVWKEVEQQRLQCKQL
eukprot:TRINITY_DN3729_c0_g1_i1.p1 TRINITY_DN3729_c0_g1~~TRINITY_DN3729_c0_g1_i1.p1  ORF type:complete len:198 (+),score=40.90 TRINITY_DN3729_c0_g1_i1:73-594(+)